MAKQIADAQKDGDKLGLTADELAFYDALTKPQAVKDFYQNEELIAITKELADSSERQTMKLSQFNESVELISNVVQENTNISIDIEKNGIKLANTAGMLKEELKDFKINH